MPFNVIGLISGGKDSLYSLAHCVQNGHKLVALANLHPAVTDESRSEVEEDDMDSFMYQTVGHSIVPLYAKALQVPLYRRAIAGEARQTGRYYDTSPDDLKQDEVEDMFVLVQHVLKLHPEANALNAGAILSTYQRTRVESTAVRLGLTPLAYLWQYPLLPPPSYRQDSLTGLLEDMKTTGCESHIIKIASGGISSDLLARNVADPCVTVRLIDGLAPFFVDHEQWLRGSVLGEGGEYETIALSGPAILWKQRINLEFTSTQQGEGGTQYSNFGNATLELLDEVPHRDIPVPALFDARFTAILQRLDKRQEDATKPRTADLISAFLSKGISRSYGSIQLANLICLSTNMSPEEQLEAIIVDAKSELLHLSENYTRDIFMSDVVSVTMIVSSMSDFAALNRVYMNQLWPRGLPNPPARVTICAPLPQGVHVSLSLQVNLASIESSQKGLHVQSLSYWAPANIGPYSQAISAPLSVLKQQGTDDPSPLSKLEIMHMAGQIPLVPQPMTLSTGSFEEQAVLALQHLWRVGQERCVDVWAGAGVAYLNMAYESDISLRSRVEIAFQVWQMANSMNSHGHILAEGSDFVEEEPEEEIVDIWELKNTYRGLHSTITPTVGEHLHVLPNHNLFHQLDLSASNLPKLNTKACQVPFVAAVVSDLPRSASIEWWSTGISGLEPACKTRDLQLSAFRHLVSEHVVIHLLKISHKQENRRDDMQCMTVSSFSCFAVTIIDTDFTDEDLLTITKPLNNFRLLLELQSGQKMEVNNCHTLVNLQQTQIVDILSESGNGLNKSVIINCHDIWAASMSDDESWHAIDGMEKSLRNAAMVSIHRFDVSTPA